MIINYYEEKNWIYEILKQLGATNEEAKASTKVLSEADLRGYPSHGIMRLKYIIKGAKSGTMNIPSSPKFTKVRESIGFMDGDHGIGHFVTMKATHEAMTLCNNTGIGMVGINNSNHFGMGGIYAEKFAENNMIGIIISSSDPVVHAFGGIDPVMGTNSVAIGIPYKGTPILLDMATSESSRGKILEAKRRGEKIPKNWAISQDGKATDDPTVALLGALNSFGGFKGYALSIIVSILAGAFVGAEMGSKVIGTLDLKERCTKGDLIFAIDPYIFEEKHIFEGKLNYFIDEIKNSRRGDKNKEIMIPGEGSRNRRKEGLERGYRIEDSTLSELREVLLSYSMKCPF